MEHDAAARWACGADLSQRALLCASWRGGAWPSATGARRGELHRRELRSTDRERADVATCIGRGRGPGNPAWCLGRALSRPHPPLDGGAHRVGRTTCLLYQRPVAYQRTPRRYVGDGLRSGPAALYRGAQALLQTGHSGGVVGALHPRPQPADGLRELERQREAALPATRKLAPSVTHAGRREPGWVVVWQVANGLDYSANCASGSTLLGIFSRGLPAQ